MEITVHAFADLSRLQPANPVKTAQGSTAAELIGRLNIDPEDVKLIFVNGEHVEPTTELLGGDVVKLFPAIGGG